MYRIVGYRAHLSPAAKTLAAVNLGAVIGPDLIGIMLGTLPDGVIIQVGDGGCGETRRGQLVPLNQAEAGEMITERPAVEFWPTANDYYEWIQEAQRLYAGWSLQRRRGYRGIDPVKTVGTAPDARRRGTANRHQPQNNLENREGASRFPKLAFTSDGRIRFGEEVG